MCKIKPTFVKVGKAFWSLTSLFDTINMGFCMKKEIMKILVDICRVYKFYLANRKNYGRGHAQKYKTF